jgi:hypothetical protein
VSDILGQSLQRVYGEAVKRWQSLDEWGRARMMAEADARGDGDLLAEALRTAPVGEKKGGIERIMDKLRGPNGQSGDQGEARIAVDPNLQGQLDSSGYGGDTGKEGG